MLVFQFLKHKFILCISIFSELEIRLNESETEKFNIKQMKDLFEQKAAQLATEIVGKFPAFNIYPVCFFYKIDKIVNGFKTSMCFIYQTSNLVMMRRKA